MVDAPHHGGHDALSKKQKGEKLMESDAVGADAASQRTKAMVAAEASKETSLTVASTYHYCSVFYCAAVVVFVVVASSGVHEGGTAVHHGRRHGFARPLLGLALVPNCSFLFPALFCEAYTPLKTLVETVPRILSGKKDGWGVQGVT